MKYFEGVKPWGCTAGHPAGTTVRFTTDNRLYVRNGFSYATHLTTSHQRIRRAVPKLRRAFENRFPEIKHVNFEFIYGGMINMTMNFRPLMTQKHPSVYASASGEGAGVAKTCLMGHYIAEWINGIDSEELRFLRRIATPSHIPPEPLTTIGRHRPPDVGRVQRQVGNLKKRNMAGRLHVGRRAGGRAGWFPEPSGKAMLRNANLVRESFPGLCRFLIRMWIGMR